MNKRQVERRTRQGRNAEISVASKKGDERIGID